MALGEFGGLSSRAEEVEVTAVKCLNVRAPHGSPGNWWEISAALVVKPAAGSIGQMVGRVRVGCLVGFELPALAGGERRLEHFRAEVECVALDAGRADVRFYLPPELVKRYQLHAEPKYWGLELSVGGKPLPAVKSAYSANLGATEQRKNFQTRAAVLAAPNDGVLLPQFLTPFVYEYPRATPSFVRREAK